MSMMSDGPSSRGGFFLDVVGGVGVGVLGLGLATERATAYEVCAVYVVASEAGGDTTGAVYW